VTLRRRQRTATLALAAVLSLSAGASSAQSDYDAARADLIRTLESYRPEMERAAGEGAIDPRVLAVMSDVPRHLFVPEDLRRRAYDDRPLPIGQGQTISQPLIVALMTSLLRPQRHHRVLEIGTGSGYQAAVLAPLVARVYTIEIVEPLARQAEERLKRLGFANVEVRAGDGYQGWPEAAPFDGIIVTAAPDRIPGRLVEQLKPGGRMVVPIGETRAVQRLTVIEKDSSGATRVREVLPVRFVPMTGGK
jgi:protein-L-isoaspartate(D-aspartate) O-methyltransferase